MSTKAQKKVAYETDYNQWIEETVKQLQDRDFEAVDWKNLIEEVIDLGKSEKNAVKSLLTRLLEHLLKLSYWEAEKSYNSRKWRSEIVTFRIQIQDRLEDSPSLKVYLESIHDHCLKSAIASMSELFDIPSDVYITLDEALESDLNLNN
ncbi:DUF29 domain-containing protein [Chroococcus sp. FPU101]|uniref:DUF29 domain-containing protein n=1 Tax=Chroococcus sp. FPU101 TaxID=1974212 RepID=UPI001A8DF057|nr:DUF29 domain-containing protein [Chroococcus sp. FPU101]GFE68783.1 hypothetical protein CFPU101_13930 [Chroococcus sp. FPU101]